MIKNALASPAGITDDQNHDFLTSHSQVTAVVDPNILIKYYSCTPAEIGKV